MEHLATVESNETEDAAMPATVHSILRRDGSLICEVAVHEALLDRGHPIERIALELAVQQGVDLSGADLTNYNLRNAYLPAAKLADSTFNNAVVDGADLSDSDVSGSVFNLTLMERAIFDRADARMVTIASCDPRNCSMVDIRAQGLRMLRSEMKSCDWSRAELEGARFEDCTIEKTRFPNANLQGAKLRRLTLNSCSFDHANMERLPLESPLRVLGADDRCEFEQICGHDLDLLNVRGFELCLRSVDVANVNLQGADLRAADLSAGVKIRAANARKSNFDGANLANSCWIQLVAMDSNLARANMREAIFVASVMTGCDLTDAFCAQASMVEINLSNSDLTRTAFDNARLPKVRLNGCILVETQFPMCDLQEAHMHDSKILGINIDGAQLAGLLVTGPDVDGDLDEDLDADDVEVSREADPDDVGDAANAADTGHRDTRGKPSIAAQQIHQSGEAREALKSARLASPHVVALLDRARQRREAAMEAASREDALIRSLSSALDPDQALNLQLDGPAEAIGTGEATANMTGSGADAEELDEAGRPGA